MTLPSWQQPNWASLQRYLSQQRIPQALLFTGPKGYGKHQLAEHFAKALLCQRPQDQGQACGTCGRCLLFAAGNHPDFMVLEPLETSKAISVDQVRNLIGRLSLKPQFEQYRVVLIDPADAMNTASMNAFLKCLEEPTERTVILLITDRPSKLPATIASRCQKLAMAKPDPKLARLWLAEQKPDIAGADWVTLLALAQNAPLQALAYAQHDALKQRGDCFKAWLALAKQQTHPVMVAEQWQSLPETQVLAWLSSWVTDLIKCAYQDGAENLANPDLAPALQALAGRLNIKKLYTLYDMLIDSRQRLDTNANKLILFEEILIYWSQLNRSK